MSSLPCVGRVLKQVARTKGMGFRFLRRRAAAASLHSCHSMRVNLCRRVHPSLVKANCLIFVNLGCSLT